MRYFAFILTVACCQSVFGQPIKFQSAPANRIRQETRDSLKLSDFKPVTGTPFLIASIRSHSDKGSFSKSTPDLFGSAANYVFFDSSTDTTTTLLPDNNALIESLTPLTENSIVGRQLDESVRPIRLAAGGDTPSPPQVRWHIAEVIARDTDGDGDLTRKDRRTLGVADAGGREYVEVIPNLGDVFARELIDANTLLIIHGSQSRQMAVRIDLPQRKIISSKPLPAFGTR